MTTTASSLIFQQLDHTAEAAATSYRLLWIADENFDLAPQQLTALQPYTTILTNRIDVARACADKRVTTVFSDFDASMVEGKFDTIVYRVSKERYVSHHCINAAANLLKQSGRLVLCGKKQEGIKTYVEKTIKILGFRGRLEKAGEWYLADLAAGETPPFACLDDGDYTRIRPIAECFGYQLSSKPGVYGWKSIDAGSTLLAEQIQEELGGRDLSSNGVLDLGCGSGYLTLLAASLGFDRIQATDNNAAAVDITRYNCDANGITAKVNADDCGEEITERFDYIFCNPPFHQGFDTSRDLTGKFTQATHRLLCPGGTAYFVVNAFISLETEAKKVFYKVEQLHNNRQFKVIRLLRCP